MVHCAKENCIGLCVTVPKDMKGIHMRYVARYDNMILSCFKQNSNCYYRITGSKKDNNYCSAFLDEIKGWRKIQKTTKRPKIK